MAKPHFEEWHETSRHAIHLSEALSVTIETVQGIQRQQKAIHESLSSGLEKAYREEMQEYMSFQLQMVKALLQRSNSTYERLKNEVTLVINPSMVSYYQRML